MRRRCDLYKCLCTKVCEQTSRLSHLFNKDKQAKIDAAVEDANRKEAEKKKAAAKAAATKAAGRLQPKPKSHKILDSQHLLPEMKISTTDELIGLTLPWRKPRFVETFSWAIDKPIADGVTHFVEVEFKPSRQYTTCGRGAKQIEATQSEIKAKITDCLRDGQTLLSKLGRNEKAFIETPWHFAFSPGMHAAGPEYAMLASMKYQIQGDRLVICAPFDQLLSLTATKLQANGEETDNITAQQVVDWFAEADAVLTSEMSDFALKVNVCGDSLLFMPWGWVVVEKTLNGSINSGIRWLMLSNEASPEFAKLALACMPSAGKVKPNTSIAFLARLLTLLDVSNEASASVGGMPKPLCDAVKAKMEKIEVMRKRVKVAPKEEQVAESRLAKKLKSSVA